MNAICGANCNECEKLKNNKCQGCESTKGCPFGKKCWIAKYIEVGGKGNFKSLKKQILEEVNSIKIDGMPKVEELYPLQGAYVNLEYQLPNGLKTRFLKDDESYLGNQVECLFNEADTKKCFGIVANMSFILICEYEENVTNPEILIYKKR